MKTVLVITKHEIRSYTISFYIFGIIFFCLGIFGQIVTGYYLIWIFAIFAFFGSVGMNIFVRKNYYEYDKDTEMTIDDEDRKVSYNRKGQIYEFSFDDIDYLEFVDSYMWGGDYYVSIHLKNEKEFYVSCSLIGEYQLSKLLPGFRNESTYVFMPTIPDEYY